MSNYGIDSNNEDLRVWLVCCSRLNSLLFTAEKLTAQGWGVNFSEEQNNLIGWISFSVATYHLFKAFVQMYKAFEQLFESFG